MCCFKEYAAGFIKHISCSLSGVQLVIVVSVYSVGSTNKAGLCAAASDLNKVKRCKTGTDGCSPINQ